MKEGSRGGLGRALGVEPFLLFAVLGVFFPWVSGSGVSLAGIRASDGIAVLALAAGAFLLQRSGVRWAWIPAALGALISVRALLRVLDATGVGVGAGLWMTTAGLVVGAIWLLAREIARVRR